MKSGGLAKWLIISGALLVIGTATFGLIRSIQTTTKVYIGSTVVHAKLAKTPADRQRGLGGTQPLGSHQGMLFIFDSDSQWPFWMKDVTYNLDIIWLDEHKRVVDIAPNVSPDTYPTRFTPKKPARYVLEVPGNFAARNNITIGTIAQFDL